MTEKIVISPIGHIETGFSSKFGIPRQGGIVKELCGRIVFEKPYSSPEYFRGLSEFSHIWVLWLFSETPENSIKATVRPPKLGGNKRMGVFATRSPFRPNRIGMSALKLEKIETTEKEGTVLYVKGADMLSGTPILDIKPYLPFSDSQDAARGGFSDTVLLKEEKRDFKVEIEPEVLSVFPVEHREEFINILKQDPRPAYIADRDRVFSFEFYGYNIKFTVQDNCLKVTRILKVN